MLEGCLEGTAGCVRNALFECFNSLSKARKKLLRVGQFLDVQKVIEQRVQQCRSHEICRSPDHLKYVEIVELQHIARIEDAGVF